MGELGSPLQLFTAVAFTLVSIVLLVRWRRRAPGGAANAAIPAVNDHANASRIAAIAALLFAVAALLSWALYFRII